jgi:hypothetical protein
VRLIRTAVAGHPGAVSRRRPVLLVAVAVAGLLPVAAGCGGPGRFVGPKVLAAAPEPASSPPLTTAPAGRMVAVGSGPEGIVSTSSGLLVVAVHGPRPGLDLLQGSEPSAVRFVALDGTARHLALAGPGGPLLVPVESDDRLDEVSLPAGNVLESVPVGRQPHDAAAAGATVAVGDELANTVEFLRSGREPVVQAAPVQPGGVAAGDGIFVVVGVRGRVMAAYTPAGVLIDRVACGAGPTHVVAGARGWFYVTDTNGGKLLVFHFAGRRLEQVATVALGSRPYGIAADPATGWIYVTLTATNQLVGLRMGGARVEQRRTWPTGRQPNTVAVDQHDGLIAITATDSAQVELIPANGPAA